MSDFSKKCRILLIDDDPIYLFGLKKLIELKTEKGEVIEKRNGEDAMEYLNYLIKNEIQFPDYILLDLNMPIKDGWDVLEEYKTIPEQQKKHTSLYIMSSSIALNDIERSKKYSDVISYLIKPISVEFIQQMNQG